MSLQVSLKTSFPKLENSPGPVITYSVAIHSNLKLETGLFEHELFLKVDKFKSLFILNYINILPSLLEKINHLISEEK